MIVGSVLCPLELKTSEATSVQVCGPVPLEERWCTQSPPRMPRVSSMSGCHENSNRLLCSKGGGHETPSQFALRYHSAVEVGLWAVFLTLPPTYCKMAVASRHRRPLPMMIGGWGVWNLN